MAFTYNAEEAMGAVAKAAAARFSADLKARILAELSAMVDEVVAEITKDMETRAYKKMDALADTIIVQYINNAKPKEP